VTRVARSPRAATEVGLVDRVAVELGDQSGVAVDHVA
jgi:hypothetical protein